MFVIAGISGAASVALAALAAHGLAHMASDGPRAVGLFMQAADFELKHAVAAILAALMEEWAAEGCNKGYRAAAVLFTLAAILFPTALYSSALGGPVFWAPLGGFAAMAGWITLAVCSLLSLFRHRAG
jgi:uncharacterized membrane protein YgdD (TMEM256/DUF423 family)